MLKFNWKYLIVLLFAGLINVAYGQPSSTDSIKIGVLEDMSGVYADLAGPGSVVAAQLAIDEFGGKVLGRTVQLLQGDLQNKADIGASIARRWIDQEGVKLITGLGSSAVALAVQGMAVDKDILVITTSGGTTELTESQCSPNGMHWSHDTYAMPVAVVRGLLNDGKKNWYFITADYTFGHTIQKNTAKVIEEVGGKIIGSSMVPLNSADFSSYILKAAASNPEVIALAISGGDLVNAVKQMGEFQVRSENRDVALLLTFITDIKSMGNDRAQGLKFATSFYWDRTPESREWSNKFYQRFGKMPTMPHAATYSAVRAYLSAIEKAGTVETKKVRQVLGEMEINDIFTKHGKILKNGLMSHDIFIAEVKDPAEVAGEWDLLKIIDVVPADQAWIPLSESKCPLLR